MDAEKLGRMGVGRLPFHGAGGDGAALPLRLDRGAGLGGGERFFLTGGGFGGIMSYSMDAKPSAPMGREGGNG